MSDIKAQLAALAADAKTAAGNLATCARVGEWEGAEANAQWLADLAAQAQQILA